MAKKVDIKSFISELGTKLKEKMKSKAIVSFDDLKSIGRKKDIKRVLIVEDDHFVRESLRRTLELDGHRVTLASDGMELMDLMDEFPFDLIILDVGLPWLNGYELAEMMQKHPVMKKTPIVFVSGHTDIDAIKKGFRLGAGDYITKPFEIDTVRKTVNTLIELNS